MIPDENSIIPESVFANIIGKPLEVADRRGYDELWHWFGLSRASWLVLPRSFMHQMPDLWQEQMADLLKQFERSFNGIDMEFEVRGRINGKMAKIPEFISNYRHPDLTAINQLRNK
jgi:hypothetical protein